MKELTKTTHFNGTGTIRCVQMFSNGIRRVTTQFRSESWHSYLIIPRCLLIEGIRRRLAGAQYHDCDWWSLIPGVDRWIAPAGSGGPGLAFASKPIRAASSRRYFVITQSGGIDI